MTLDILYHYLWQPLHIIEKHKLTPPLTVAYTALGVLTGLVILITNHISLLFGMSIILFLCFLCGFQSVAIDFLAQWHRYKAQSLALFTWLSISTLPLSGILYCHYIFPEGPIKNLITLTLFSYMIYLQVKTVQTLYRSSIWVSVALYTAPFLIVSTALFSMMTLTISFLS